MTSPLFAVLARTLTASSLAEPARLEAAAHGTVTLRAGFIRREVVRDRNDGEIPMLDAEPLATITEADAPDVEIGDLIWVSGALWRVRSPLADGGLVKLQLMKPETETVRIGGRDVTVHVAGHLDDVEHGGSIVALTRSRVAPGPCEIGRDAWTVTDAEAWGDGWDRLVLTLD